MNYDRLIALRSQGMRSEGLGPDPEWDPVAEDEFQVRHNGFWRVVAGLMEDSEDDEGDPPFFMSEEMSQKLEVNK